MRVELLSPVGNMETLYQAIHNGCDAVYLGGKNFGARKYSENFTNEELKDAVRYAHLFNVKVYVTVNTIVYEREIKEFLEYIFYLHKINVDALIMQDLGMIKMVKEKFPNIEIHASTQCHNHNNEGIKLLKSLGVTRVVLDREMSLKEINAITEPIEKEVFVHGALCVSYSGCCLFSSLNGGRSGNRGECTQCCRLPYSLYKDDEKVDTLGKYLLSTRELNTLGNLREILDSKITSLKIEGRMKSPEYVGYVTRLYRKLIDAYYNNEEMIITNEELNNLKLLFNREFTSGYLFNDQVMNVKTPNHQGLEIGKVIRIEKGKVYIRLNYPLNQGDGIRFRNADAGMVVNKLYNDDGLLVNSVNKDDIAVLDNKLNVKGNDIVLKTTDRLLLEELRRYPKRKIGIDVNVLVNGNALAISIMDFEDNVVELVIEVESANNNPTDAYSIERCFSKLGDTIYELNSINVSYNDDIFIPISKLNDLRRTLLGELSEKRINKYNKRIILSSKGSKVRLQGVDKKYKLNILVRNEDQLLVCIKNDIDTIYTTDKDLYNRYKELTNVFYKTPRVMSEFFDLRNGNILASELGSINRYGKYNTLNVDYTLNVVNASTIELFNSLNVNLVTLSVELTYDDIKEIMKRLYNVELYIYGKVELMVMRYCPLKLNLNHCNVCKSDSSKYFLKDSKDRMYRLLNSNCLTSVMDYKNINRINDIERYKKLGIYNYRVDLLDETIEELEGIIAEIRKKL